VSERPDRNDDLINWEQVRRALFSRIGNTKEDEMKVQISAPSHSRGRQPKYWSLLNV
jgi:hypothetical protein